MLQVCDCTMADGISLSDYARELSVSNKRRYLEKIAGIQNPYSIAAAELSKDVFHLSRTPTSLAHRNGLKLIKAWILFMWIR